MEIIATSKSELKASLTSKLGGYNFFQGDIRRGNRYARVHYYYTRSKITIQVTYWEDGINHAVDYASNCSTHTGVANKVARFLDLK